MEDRFRVPAGRGLLLAALLITAPPARADVVTDANAKATAIASTLSPTPIAIRTMALVQVAVYDAVNTISGRYRPLFATTAAPAGASIDAAVAAASHAVLLDRAPAQRAAIEADYQAALGELGDDRARADGVAVGATAAAAVLAARAGDGFDAPNAYRPEAAPGVYVPTTLPVVPQWGARKPWAMSAGNQFRPGPPPALDSEVFQRDLAEIKALGGKTSARRTPEQTEIARFWETTSPSVYWPIACTVAGSTARDASECSRVLALAAIAMDDAAIAVFDAKYAYRFWRPITAIRSMARDSADRTWTPLIDTPMHPEYPCAHCIVSAALAAAIQGAVGPGPLPTLHSSSSTAIAGARSWQSFDEFTREVSEARILDGVHYRNSTEVGTAMGRRVGELAAKWMPAK